MEADVGPVRGQLVPLPPRIVADHERDAVRAQQLVDIGREPALVAKLEAVTPRRQARECGREALVVAAEVARQLPQHRVGFRNSVALRIGRFCRPIVSSVSRAEIELVADHTGLATG